MRLRWLLGAGLVAAGAAGCLGATTESRGPVDVTTPGAWTTLAPMPTARQEVAVATLGGSIYVIGGYGPSALPMITVEAYDPATNEWTTKAPLPTATHHPAAAVVNGRLFVIGGYTGGRMSSTAVPMVYEYDPSRNAWTARAPLPTPRGALAAVVLNGRIHALGGSDEGPTGVHEVYDVASNRWTAANPMPTPRDHLAAVAFQGRVWALGGRTSFTGQQFDKVEIYDPATNSWQTGPPLPGGRGGLAAAVLADRIFVFGGEAPFRIFNATEMYEPAGNRWIVKAPMLTPRHGIGAAVAGGRIYVPGGGREPLFAPSDVNEAYTP
jgi:N-acetylneuraminic acid mutarotase